MYIPLYSFSKGEILACVFKLKQPTHGWFKSSLRSQYTILLYLYYIIFFNYSLSKVFDNKYTVHIFLPLQTQNKEQVS